MKNSLPNLSLPTYKLTLPSTGEEVTYQPFTREQEKAILIAQQEEDYSALIATMTNLLKSCCDAEITTMADFVYVSAHVKAKSHGEAQSFSVAECECGHKDISIKVDNILDHLKVENQGKLLETYTLRGLVTLKLIPLKTSVFDQIKTEETIDNMLEQLDIVLAGSIDYVLNGTEVIKDFTYEELQSNILSTLTRKEIEEIQEKISNLINVFYEIKYVCPNCKEEFTKEISDFLL